MEGGGNTGGMNPEVPCRRDPLKSKYRFEASGSRSSRERGWVRTGHDNVSPLTSSQNTAVCPPGSPLSADSLSPRHQGRRRNHDASPVQIRRRVCLKSTSAGRGSYGYRAVLTASNPPNRYPRSGCD